MLLSLAYGIGQEAASGAVHNGIIGGFWKAPLMFTDCSFGGKKAVAPAKRQFSANTSLRDSR